MRVPLAPPGINITTTDFSLEAWVKLGDNGGGLIVGNLDVNNRPHWMLVVDGISWGG